MPTLLTSNYKLEKTADSAYLVKGLSIAPHSLGNGRNVCPQATDACKAACVLWYTGRTVTPSVRNAMASRKERFFQDRVQFYSDLAIEIDKFRKSAARKGREFIPAIRLNVGSDIDHRRFISDRHIIEQSDGLPAVQYYDYSKVYNRVLSQLPGTLSLFDTPNYEITYSWSERSKPRETAILLDAKVNVAMVFDTEYNPRQNRIGKLPLTVDIDGSTYPVVDGDKIDVRRSEVDGQGVVVGLRFKGSKAKKADAIESGFVVESVNGKAIA